MIESRDFGDVTALRCSWGRSRLIGYAVHAYLVRGVLIDCGFPALAPSFRRWLDATPTVRGAFLTHHHEDHAGNLATLAARGIPVAADARTLQLAMTPAPLAFYRRFAWAESTPVAHDITPFEHDEFRLLPTPGHCADHQAVWDSATGTLFAGDLFLGVRASIAHHDEDPRGLVESLRAMIALGPARVFCSHRGLLPDGTSRLEAKADWLEERIAHIDARIAAGDNDQAIRKAVLGKRPATHWFSRGAYSPDNFVAAVRDTRREPSGW
jgi:endoribonuclease LACTB2